VERPEDRLGADVQVEDEAHTVLIGHRLITSP
jgi:hypothetical protein